MNEPQGTTACPICGKDTPHRHTDEELAEYYGKPWGDGKGSCYGCFYESGPRCACCQGGEAWVGNEIKYGRIPADPIAILVVSGRITQQDAEKAKAQADAAASVDLPAADDIAAGRRGFRDHFPREEMLNDAQRIGWDEAAQDAFAMSWPGTPTYYVRHPDDSFSVADPQPVAVVTNGERKSETK